MKEKAEIKDKLIDVYHQRIKHAEEEIQVFKSLSFKYSMVRLGVFFLSFPIIYFLLKTNVPTLIIVISLLVSLFLWAVVRQLKYDKLLKQSEALKAINENEITTILHHENIYYNGEEYQLDNHSYSEDLDIFGAHSIFGLINRSRTFFGNQILKNLFLEKTKKDQIYRRQEAIKELSDEINWRQDLAVNLFHLEDLQHINVAESINEQLSIDMNFAINPLIIWYRRLLPIIWITIAILYYLENELANTLLATFFIGNLLLVGKYTKEVNKIQGKLSQTSDSIKKYIDALRIIFDKKWSSDLLKEQQSKFIGSDGELPIKSLSELSSLINKLDYRLNLLVAIFANAILLWDLWIVANLHTWKTKNKEKVDEIFSHIGFMEAMSSLATWAYNNPEYSFPEIHDNYMHIDAKGIEHPLIPDAQNVENDFLLLSKDKVSIITGSNMSGKSTFLRTLGINMILAYTGTKSAAQTFSIPIVTIVTYMRIKDALEENVSTFKAELNRISMILDILKREPNAFIIIDEMLRGTNSKDKLNGSIAFTKKLLTSPAYAIIATHDIKLAELGQEEDRIANYYFDIDYADGDLVFDYKIKPGICENFNASFLLGQLGIDTKQ